jgi:hypothetical protein
MSVNDTHRNVDSRGMLQIVASLTDYSTGVVHHHYMFILQATGAKKGDWGNQAGN